MCSVYDVVYYVLSSYFNPAFGCQSPINICLFVICVYTRRQSAEPGSSKVVFFSFMAYISVCTRLYCMPDDPASGLVKYK